jgi:hypothetical protein
LSLEVGDTHFYRALGLPSGQSQHRHR